MKGDSVALDDKGLALLGNALLLGYQFRMARKWLVAPELLANFQELWRTDPDLYREERRCASEHEDLRELLELAGMRDDRLDGPFGIGDESPPDRLLENANRLNALVNSDEEIATLRLSDIEFSAAMDEKYGITDALCAADDDDVGTPLAHLGPTALTRRVLDLVSGYLRGEIATQLNISRGAATFIGWEGVRGRALARNPTVPDWLRWNSDEAKKCRREMGWLEDLRGKAERLMLEPVLREYGQDACGQDLEELAELAIRHRRNQDPRSVEFHLEIGGLATRLCFENPDVPQTSDEIITRIFRDDGAAQHHCFKADADARNFLNFASSQVAWHAAAQGLAACIAEDGLASGGGIYSWVRPERFSQLCEPGRIALPEELDVEAWADLDSQAKAEVGADRLWFALTRDLVEMSAYFSSKPGPKSGADRFAERMAANALTALHRSDPEARIVKTEVSVVLRKHGFSDNGAGRIWDAGAPDTWKDGRRPAKTTRRFVAEDFEEMLTRHLK